MISRRSSFLILVLAVLGLVSGAAAQQQTVRRPAGWTDATHGSRVAPDYRRLFAMDRVHELRITIPADSFKAMQADLVTLAPAGMPGFGPGAGGPGRGGFDPNQMMAMMEAAGQACVDKPAESACSSGGVDGKCTPMFGGPLACVPEAMARMMAGGAINLTTRDPMYVPVSVTHDGKVWTNVAMRYKGNSSLVSAAGAGNGKVPFRLDFGRNKKDDPSIDGQKFYGFEEMTFSSNFTDDSQLREVLGSEVFRDRGVPAPRAAFYRIHVDVGSGPEYWGLYTMVEDPGDGAMLDAQLAGRAGNLYKPDGVGADWTKFSKEGFSKKNNEREANFSDVEAAIAALHAPRTNPAAWRENLESTFDADLFLKWLAVNTAVDNWDTYGAMAHNYYLYGDPRRSGRLQWIPWDNNMSFGMSPFGRGNGAPPGFAARGGPPAVFPPRGAGAGPAGAPPAFFAARFGGAGNVLHTDVGEQWPLIRILMADDVYSASYRRHLEFALGGLFAPEALARRARELHALIAPYVVGPQGERETHRTVSSPTAFTQAVDGPGGLLDTAQKRRATIRDALRTASR
jgi:hypothetical protein